MTMKPLALAPSLLQDFASIDTLPSVCLVASIIWARSLRSRNERFEQAEFDDSNSRARFYLWVTRFVQR